MPKVIWKDYLANPTEARGDLTDNAERALQAAIRERARRCMDDLIDIIEGMKRFSKDPGREYEHVFQDEQRYFRLLEALSVGYKKSLQSMLRRGSPNLTVKDLEDIQMACIFMGMKTPPSLRQLRERHCRRKSVRMLAEKLQDPVHKFSYLDAVYVRLSKRRLVKLPK